MDDKGMGRMGNKMGRRGSRKMGAGQTEREGGEERRGEEDIIVKGIGRVLSEGSGTVGEGLGVLWGGWGLTCGVGGESYRADVCLGCREGVG